MSKIVQQSLSTIWVIYGIAGACLVFISTIFVFDEDIFMYVSILYGLLGVILLILNKYNKSDKQISFEEEFKEDLENLENLNSEPDEIPEDKEKAEKEHKRYEQIKKASTNTLPPKYNIANDQIISSSYETPTTSEAFSTSATNGLYL
mgnify:CR=1 FL=1